MSGIFTGIDAKIEMGNACDQGLCPFCFPMARAATKEAAKETFLKTLEKNLTFYGNEGGMNIILTGGEPLDLADPDKLFGALKIIFEIAKKRGIQWNLVTLYTNGIKLRQPVSKKSPETFLKKLAACGLKDINLSIHGLTREARISLCGKPMGELDFGVLIPTIRAAGIRVMVRTTLTNVEGGITSVDDLNEFTKQIFKCGANSLYGSNLFKCDKYLPGSEKVIQWIADHRIDFPKFIGDTKNSKHFEFIAETTRHNNQGRSWIFLHKETKREISLGELTIGNEPDNGPTYCYIKPNGEMGFNNNTWEDTIPPKEYRTGRPG